MSDKKKNVEPYESNRRSDQGSQTKRLSIIFVSIIAVAWAIVAFLPT